MGLRGVCRHEGVAIPPNVAGVREARPSTKGPYEKRWKEAHVVVLVYAASSARTTLLRHLALLCGKLFQLCLKVRRIPAGGVDLRLALDGLDNRLDDVHTS